jgi:glycosyltransferase involved in cell wall biosynthesis
MKILCVFAQPPSPQGGAAGRCAWALLQGLEAHGLEVQALAARRPHPDATETPTSPAVELVDVDPYGPSWTERLRRLRMPRSELVGALSDRVRAEAAHADVLHLDELESSWCAVPGGPPAVVHLHYLVEEDRGPGAPWRRPFWTYLEERLAERLAAKRQTELIANSPRVADLLRKLAPRAHVTVVPLSLDPTQYRRAPLDGAPRAGLIGTLDWPPTKGAVRTLLREVWPAVSRQVPEARLLVAGRGTDRLEGSATVDVIGRVASSADFLDQLSVLLYPVVRGSGMKVKVLEAMASGIPVVTTKTGAEGIAANDGVVVAEDSAALAQAAIEILSDPKVRRERGNAALACFGERYAPARATQPLVALYETLAAEGTGPTTGPHRSSRAA